MTVQYIEGNLFDSNADAFAHGCNTAGIMASGIAKTMHEVFPRMYLDYHKRCLEGKFRPGTGYIFENPSKPHIINLATQSNTREAKLEYVKSAFDWVAQEFPNSKIKSIAIPKIACGLGGLEWEEVGKVLEKRFSKSPLELEIWSYR